MGPTKHTHFGPKSERRTLEAELKKLIRLGHEPQSLTCPGSEDELGRLDPSMEDPGLSGRPGDAQEGGRLGETGDGHTLFEKWRERADPKQ